LTNISLLPPEIKIEEKNAKKRFIAIAASAFVISLFIILFVSLRFAVSIADKELTQEKQNVNNLKAEIGEISIYTDLQKKVDDMDNIYNSAMDNTPNWIILLKNINQKLQSDIMFLELIADKDDEKEYAEILIRGWVKEPYSISCFVNKLEEINDINSVKLTFFQENEYNNEVVYYFNVLCAVSPFDYKLELPEGSL
jgi:hypothetical protein